MTKTKDDEEQKQSGGLAIILIVAAAIAALVGLYAFSNMINDKRPEAPELPLCSILVDVNAFDANARRDLVALETALDATGVVQKAYGPKDVKVLLPGAKPGDTPTTKAFGDLTDEEWEKAWKYLSMTEHLVPRVFRVDGTACVIRCDAKGGHDFPPDAATKIVHACEAFTQKFKGLKIYSRALGLGSAQDRDALNASFGCQLSFIFLIQPQTTGGAPPVWRSADSLAKLAQVKHVLSKEKRFLRVTTDANWVQYYWTTKLQTEKEASLSTKDEEVAEALDFAKANGIGLLANQDRRRAIVDTSTNAEGQENAELMYYMAANLQVELKVEVDSPYAPKIHPADLKSVGPIGGER